MRTNGRIAILRTLVVGLAAAGALLAAAPASAAPAVPQPVDETFTVDNCGFDVQVHITGNEKTIELGSRTLLLAPGQRATLTNVETGASVRKNISGPGLITDTPTDDGGTISVFRGWGNWIHLRPGEVWHTRGPWVQSVELDADGNLLSRDEDFSRARAVDMCQELS